MKQHTWFRLHHWAGFHLSLLLSFVLLTGTLATISVDLDWLSNPAIRANAMLSNKQKLQWPALLNSAQSYLPDSQIDSIHRPAMPWHNVEVIARDKQGQRFRIYLDAHNFEVTGEGAWFNWQRFFREVHRHFMLPIKVGVSIVGFFALLMLFLLITSLYLYRNWWRHFFSFARIKLPPKPTEALKQQKMAAYKRRFWAELHKIVGLWSSWFTLIIAITGTWYLAEQWGAGVSYPPVVTHPSIKQLLINQPEAKQLKQSAIWSAQALSHSITHIREQYPDFQIKQIRLVKGTGLIEIDGQEQAVLVRDRANKQVFNGQSGDWINGRKGEQLDWHFRISEAADPLHFGTFSSWIFRYIWFIFGIALTGLSLSGVYMYLLRLKQSGALKTQTTKHAISTLWKLSHWLKWPSLCLLLTCGYLVTMEFI